MWEYEHFETHWIARCMSEATHDLPGVFGDVLGDASGGIR